MSLLFFHLCFSQKQSACRSAEGLKPRFSGWDALRRATRKWALSDIAFPSLCVSAQAAAHA
jgi:hypothetical protein